MPGHRASRAAPSRHAARLADLEPGRLRASITSGVTPAPIDHEVAVELEPALRDDLPDPRLAGALEALELLSAVDLDAVLLEHALEEAARPRAPNCRSNVTSSSITIAHFAPRSAVSEAATSQPM